MALLEVENLCVTYGEIQAVHSVSILLESSQIVAVLGSNGAGKTTLLRAVSGLTRAKSGRVCLDGKDITTVPAHKVVAAGLCHVPEGRRLFGPLSVVENLKLGAHLERKDPRLIADRMSRVFEFFPILAERRNQLAGTLSGGEQQMLAIGRALMASPKVLALDEPSMGLAPRFITTILNIVRGIAAAGVGVLLVEQNAVRALEIAHYAYVLETGKVVLDGAAKSLIENPHIQTAYLGGLDMNPPT